MRHDTSVVLYPFFELLLSSNIAGAGMNLGLDMRCRWEE